jgi:hypothetical protein
VDVYPCPACGGVASAPAGCRRCGRPHDPQAEALAELNRRLAGIEELTRRLAGLDEATRALAADQAQLDTERARLQAEAEGLRATLRRRLAVEAGAATPAPRTADEDVPGAAEEDAPQQAVRSAARADAATPAAAVPHASPTEPAGQARQASPAEPAGPAPQASPERTPTVGTATATRPGPPPSSATSTDMPSGVPRQRAGPPPGVETSRGSARNTLLTLGGVLLAIAAVVVTGLFFTAAPIGGRAVILAVATLVALTMPLVLARRTLTATAETLAGFGLLAVFLDGYAAYRTDQFGLADLSLTLFSSVLCGLVAAVAAAYRLASHLRAPQYAALLAVQPVLPLLAGYLGATRDVLAAVFAIVAALNLGSVELLGRDPGRALRWVRLPGSAPGPGGQPWPPRLRETAWVLFGATLGTATVLSGIGLLTARTDADASRSGLVLLLAAAVGVAGGLLARRPPLGHVAGGAATFAAIVTVNRVNVLSAPDYALVLTAGVAAAIALGCRALPSRARAGPRWGSLAGAGLTGAIVVAQVVLAAVEIVRVSVTPRIWAADVSGFAERVQTIDPQVPTAAALLALLAVAAVPRGWRLDAFVVGFGMVTLALPVLLFRSAPVTWWLVPVLLWAASTVAIAAAVPAPRAASAAIRAATAGVLCLVSVAASLAESGLTALTCTLVAVSAALTVALARGSNGPYRERVADGALGAGAAALPVAVGTAAWLAGAPNPVLVTVTLLATAIGVEAAMLAPIASGDRLSARQRSGSEAGALGAAAGALLLALRVDGSTPADIGVATLLVAAAVAGLTARGTDARTRPETPSPRSPLPSIMDSRTVAAGLATAGLMVAVARLGAVLVPGSGLVLTTAVVLAAGVGIAALPRSLRDGPRLGSATVGAGAVAFASAVAALEASRAIAASTPWWHADIVAWSQRVSALAPYGPAVPVSLLLAAGAALLLLSPPVNVDAFFVLVCLAGLAMPAVTAGPWWSAPLTAGGLAAVAGVGAALVRPTDPPGTHQRRLALAGVLALYAVAVGAVTPAATATVLSGLAGAGAIVAALAAARPDVPAAVPGLAMATALAAGPGAAACLAVAFGAGREATLGTALGVCALGVVVVVALRFGPRVGAWFGRAWRDETWDGWPGAGVGLAAMVIGIAAAVSDLATGAASVTGSHPTDAPVWVAAAALLATFGAGHARPLDPDDDDPRPSRVVVGTLSTTAVPLGLFAAALSTPAWVGALAAPFQTLEHVWAGYAAMPPARGAAAAFGTLVLLAPAAGGIAVILGGRRYVLAAVLPPLAAAAVVLPVALGASREAVPWVALGVALATGLGATLTRPSLPMAATWLRGTAGVVCALTGGAGLAGSLATRSTTLAALGVLAVGGLACALLGRDPLARAVAWVVAGAAGLALPPVAALAFHGDPRMSIFGMLAVSAALVGFAWALSRWRGHRGDATVLEATAGLGAVAALALAYGSIRHVAAALTICGLLLGGAALRRDRPARDRWWLVRLAIGVELLAAWLQLYGVHIGLPEAYTLPFALAALVVGIIEQRRRPQLSSWVIYGPALAGAFLPSVALILVGDDPVWRWVSVFLAAVAIVIVGSWRGWRAPVVTGGTIAVVVAIVEMVWLLIEGQIFGAFLVGLAGVILIIFGAFAERSLRRIR